MHRRGVLLSIGILLALCACSQKAERMAPATAMQARGIAESAPAPAPELTDKQNRQPSETRRYIALRHQVEVEFPAAGLPAAFDSMVKKVNDLGGELLEASISRGTEYSPPSGSISVRLSPGAVGKFLDGVEKSGKVLRYQREAEDKTDEVIDADARIVNLTELRNRLRRMLAEKPAQIKDVIEIEKQLADTQSSLDAIDGVRKSLSKKTDFVAVKIELRSATSISERSFLAPVASAWNQAGTVLMASAGSLITFIAAVLPWLLILVPAFWFVRRVWRSWRKRRNSRAIATPDQKS